MAERRRAPLTSSHRRLGRLLAGCAAVMVLLSSSSSWAVPEDDAAAYDARAKAKARQSEMRKETLARAKEEAAAKKKKRASEQVLDDAKAKAVAKAVAKAKTKGKDGTAPAEGATSAMAAFPLLITYDPQVLGIGGPCPGDNEVSRGECALVARDLKSAREHFRDSWNTMRSPFAAMRLGDLAWNEGEMATALQWYEQVGGSTMMLRMASLRRCELEPGCGVTGRNVPSAETFIGPFGDEALLRTARIFTRSGFPELAAAILVDGDARGCDLGPETCEHVATLALAKSTTPATLALSLATRRPNDGHDEARAIAAQQLGLKFLAEDLVVSANGGTPAHRVTPQEEAEEEARVAQAAAKEAAAKEAAIKQEQEDTAKEAAAKEAAAKEAAAKDPAAKEPDAKEAAAKEAAAKEAAAKEAAVKEAAAKEAAAKEAAAKETAAKETAAREAAAGDATAKAKTDKPDKPDEKKKALNKKTKRDAIDDGVKRADESLEKAKRLLDMAGSALPLGGPK